MYVFTYYHKLPLRKDLRVLATWEIIIFLRIEISHFRKEVHKACTGGPALVGLCLVLSVSETICRFWRWKLELNSRLSWLIWYGGEPGMTSRGFSMEYWFSSWAMDFHLLFLSFLVIRSASMTTHTICKNWTLPCLANSQLKIVKM